MHALQQKLLSLAESNDLSRIPLRKIGEMVDRPDISPGVLQHHFYQLQKKGLLFIDRKAKTQRMGPDLSDERFYRIPIIGAASCGPANQFADEAIEGYLNISKSSIRSRGNLFALRAVGDSMNDADVPTLSHHKASINEGDYAIVDTSYISIDDNIGKYIVSIINGMANIKKLVKREFDYALISESKDTKAYPPIIIHQSDDYLINGRVIAVVKA